MLPSQNGSFRLFRLAGIDVLMHWSWLLVAFLELRYRTSHYRSPAWNVAEYVTLFGLVLLHEFGHALACRQVGGTAERIVLWPLGGVAVVNAPPRPGALLWSIAAGPLVNLMLLPLTVGLYVASLSLGWRALAPDVDRFLFSLGAMNLVLLVFNLLPIYPLDGGQILQAVLWYIIGRARSLMAVSVIGIVCGVGVLGVALAAQQVWIGIFAVFVVLRSIAGFRQAQALLRQLHAPRHEEFACPSCGVSPQIGPFWICHRCRERCDTFEHRAACPGCGARFAQTMCAECHQRHPMAAWARVPAAETSPAGCT